MSVTSTAAAAAASTTANPTGAVDTNAAKTKITSDLNSFLTMLTTQLKNQDPLSPMESNEFTQQLVGFAQVEQQISINENLQTMQTQLGTSFGAMTLGYIGKYAEVRDDLVKLEDGQARFAYGVASDAADVKIVLKDDNGVTVRTIQGDGAAGNHVLTWNGRDDDGTQLADGDYTIEVEAVNGAGDKVGTWSTVQARITGVSSDNGNPVVIINDAAVPLDEITAITESPTY